MGLFGNNDRLNTARYNLEQYEKTKPADYQSKYQGQIKDVMDKLENMGDFDYDPDADAAYQQYKNQYKAGDTITLTYVRAGETKKVDVTLAEVQQTENN